MSEGSYISFGVEGVPYSQVRIELVAGEFNDDAIQAAVLWARLLADLYRVEFYAENTQASNGNAKGSGLFCPEHTKVELVETIAKYQTYDTVDGVQVPAKFFCPGDKNGTGSNHSVWRSKALMPEPAGFRPD